MKRYYFASISLLIMLVTSCSTLRTDGSMNFENKSTSMIYFKTKTADNIIERLKIDFGNYEKTKYSGNLIWRQVINKDWSDTLMKMQIIRSHISGHMTESIALSIVDYKGNVLTDKRSDKLQSIKKYINEIRK
jgi:hypothetical protein